jgi:hypothetical protein
MTTTRFTSSAPVFEGGRGGAKFVNYELDGRVEIESGDERFVCAYTSCASSVRPPLIVAFDRGRFHDITRRYPQLIRSRASRAWSSYQEMRRSSIGEDGEQRGALAAWVADQYLLGKKQGERAWQMLLAEARAGHLEGTRYTPSTSAFVRQLRRDLHAWGYAR